MVQSFKVYINTYSFQNRMAFSVGKEELSEPVPLLKKLSAEFLGTMLLVIFGCGAAAGQGNENSKTMVRMDPSYFIYLS